ncbi:hypothetical protein EVAR_84089_1 [Eumeta japonica]|uniref:Uncharacterized protein n=1 Tax=Eumeta variegata TaxID=151549 RepID=A0A4C1UYS8_EUMVA|nr:hypothetical protein EVAR_84089_1 [Eumeta japonica]
MHTECQNPPYCFRAADVMSRLIFFYFIWRLYAESGLIATFIYLVTYSRNSIIRPSVIWIRDYPDCQPQRINSNMNVSELALRPARAPLDRRSTRVLRSDVRPT